MNVYIKMFLKLFPLPIIFEVFFINKFWFFIKINLMETLTLKDFSFPFSYEYKNLEFSYPMS